MVNSWDGVAVAVGASRKVKPSWGASRVVCSAREGVHTASGEGVALKQAMFKDASYLIASNPPRVSFATKCTYFTLAFYDVLLSLVSGIFLDRESSLATPNLLN